MPLEVHSDPQATANGYLADVEMANGSKLTLVTSPAQFDEEPARPTRAPEQGEHTETVLLNLGLSWDGIAKPRNAMSSDKLVQGDDRWKAGDYRFDSGIIRMPAVYCTRTADCFP